MAILRFVSVLLLSNQCCARPNANLDSLEESAIFDKFSALGQYNVSQFEEFFGRVSERLTPELINDAFGLNLERGNLENALATEKVTVLSVFQSVFEKFGRLIFEDCEIRVCLTYQFHSARNWGCSKL